jgi:MscS family membrane protein
MISKSTVLWIFFSLALAVEGLAQIPVVGLKKQATTQIAPEKIEDPLGRTTPYDTVINFIRACERGDYARAGEYLDTRDQGERRQQLARMLSKLMNAGLKVNLDSLSRNPNGNLEDGLAQAHERVGEIRIGSKSLEVTLDRIVRKGNPRIWLFSYETLRGVPGLARGQEGTWISRSEKRLPKWLVENKIGGVAFFRWILIPLYFSLLFGFAWIVTRLLDVLFRLSFRRVIQRNSALLESNWDGPVRLFLFACLVSLAGHYGYSLLIRHFWARVGNIFYVIAVTWIFLRVVDVVALHLTSRFQYRIATIQLFRGLTKGLAFIIAVLVILKFQGVDLTTALAGLGIGGLAIAFAAQKTLEDLFGTVMLVGDQPIRVGDFCRVGQTLGTIENIGLRSTRIRTLDRTVVSVPNGQVASMILENFAVRDKIWFSPTIGLRYETTADQLRYVLVNIRKLLYEHPKVESSSARIRFVKFGNSSLDLEIFGYVDATDYGKFLEIQEDLLLRIMDIVEESGTSIAFPSRTIYMTKDTGLDFEKSRASVKQVQQWRDEKNLPFPNYPPEEIAQIQDTLDYPSPDSAMRLKK